MGGSVLPYLLFLSPVVGPLSCHEMRHASFSGLHTFFPPQDLTFMLPSCHFQGVRTRIWVWVSDRWDMTSWMRILKCDGWREKSFCTANNTLSNLIPVLYCADDVVQPLELLCDVGFHGNQPLHTVACVLSLFTPQTRHLRLYNRTYHQRHGSPLMASNTIILDVSGSKFRISKAVLSVSPYFESPLERWKNCADLQADGSYFIDADADTFKYLLNFMRRPSRFLLY